MKRALKTYFAFTNKNYRLVTLILMPFIAVAGTVIAGCIDTELVPLVLVLYYVIFMIVEPMSDYWFLGGFYGKNKGAMEFMQSSNRFSTVIKDVVIVDMFRRALVNGVLFLLLAITGVIADINPRGYALFGFMAISEILFGEVAVFIARHFDLWNHYYVVIILGYMIEVILLLNSVLLFEKYLVIICIGLAVLAVAMAVITVAYTNKKVRDSYYDK